MRRATIAALATGWVLFAVSFALPASRSHEIVVSTDVFGDEDVVWAGWQDFQRSGSALFKGDPDGVTWFGNLLPPLAALAALRPRRRKTLRIAGCALFFLGLFCLRIPGEHLLFGCWTWLAAQGLSLAAIFVCTLRASANR